MKKTYYRYVNEYGDESFIRDSSLFDGCASVYIRGPITKDQVISIRDALNEFLADKDAGPLEQAGFEKKA